nr:protein DETOXIFICATION 16-like [Tanacetum cinerariifolium]
MDEQGLKTLLVGQEKNEMLCEFKKQLYIAGPLVIVNLLIFGLSMISLIFVGHLGELACSTLVLRLLLFLLLSLVLACWGATLANSVSLWINVLLLAVYVRVSPSCKKTWKGFSKEAFNNISTFVKLAVPSTVMVCLEIWSFEIMVLLSGLLPNPQLETSVLSISLNTCSMIYMIPLGLSGETSEDDVVTYAINGLSHKYGSLAQIIAHKDPFPDLATIRSMYGLNSLSGQRQPLHNSVPGPRSSAPPGFTSTQHQQAQHAFSPQQQALFTSTVQGLGIASQPNAYGQESYLLQALNTMTLQEPADLNWNMDTAASSHLNSSTIRQFVRDNKCTIEFDEFGFFVKDFWTRQILLRYDSMGDLYPITSPSYPKAFLLVKHVRLPFSPSEIVVTSPFDIIYLDLWTSPLSSVSDIKYYVLFLDQFSHYLWVYPLRNKSDALSKFIHFRAFVKN